MVGGETGNGVQEWDTHNSPDGVLALLLNHLVIHVIVVVNGSVGVSVVG